jgi:hypothetical protein
MIALYGTRHYFLAEFRTDRYFYHSRRAMNFSDLLSRIKPAYFPFLIVFFSIVVLLAFWQIAPGGAFNQAENDDHTTYYLPVGQNIANGNGITLHGKPALDYTPGFPVIVAASVVIAKATGRSENAVLRWCFVLFFVAGAVLIFALAKKIWDPYHALLASALWSCYPVVLWSAKNPSSELPFSVFLYATLLCMIEAWLARKNNHFLFILAGLFCGMSMLIRPIIIGLGILLSVLMLFGRRHTLRKRFLFCVCLMAGNCAAIAPWEIWAYSKTHEIIPLSSNARTSITLFDGLTFAVWNPFGCRQGITVPQDVRELMTEAVDKYLGHIETTSPGDLRNFLADKFRKQPVTVIKLMTIKTIRSWYGTFSNRMETPILFVQMGYLTLLIWSSLLIWKKRPDSRYLVITGTAVLCYFWGLTICVDPLVRYLMPILGALLIFFPAIPQYALRRQPRKTDLPAQRPAASS